jgi:hypothetical protein
LQYGTQRYSELFPKLNKVNMEKIMLPLVKISSPPANDELNSNVEVQHGVEHQFSANSFQNKELRTRI